MITGFPLKSRFRPFLTAAICESHELDGIFICFEAATLNEQIGTDNYTPLGIRERNWFPRAQ